MRKVIIQGEKMEISELQKKLAISEKMYSDVLTDYVLEKSKAEGYRKLLVDIAELYRATQRIVLLDKTSQMILDRIEEEL